MSSYIAVLVAVLVNHEGNEGGAQEPQESEKHSSYKRFIRSRGADLHELDSRHPFCSSSLRHG